MQIFRYWVVRNARTRFRIETLLFFSLITGITRGFLEYYLFGIDSQGSDILGFVPFYFSLPFIYAALISAVPGQSYLRLLQPVTFATLLGILPPILDYSLASGQFHSVFYGYFVSHDFAQFPWFGYAPQRSYPAGEMVTIWLTFIFAGCYVYFSTRHFLTAFLAVCLAYVAYLIFALVIPAGLSFLLYGYLENPQAVAALGSSRLRYALFLIGVAQVLTAIIVDSILTATLLTYLRRIGHMLPFILLTLLGCAISGAGMNGTIVAILVTTLVGCTVVAHNDLLEEIKSTSRSGHAVMLFNIGAPMIFLILLFSGHKFALLGLASVALSALYHYRFFNIRKSLYGSMKVEGLWAFFSFMTGLMSGHMKHPQAKAVAVGLIAFGGFSLFSVLKDAKDVDADLREGRRTVFTWLHLHRWPMRSFLAYASAIAFLLMLAAGFAYFPVRTWSLLAHAIFSLLASLLVLRVHQANYFQLFMLVVCSLILNMISYEYSP